MAEDFDTLLNLLFRELEAMRHELTTVKQELAQVKALATRFNAVPPGGYTPTDIIRGGLGTYENLMPGRNMPTPYESFLANRLTTIDEDAADFLLKTTKKFYK